MTATTDAPVEFDPYAYEIHEDPYPTYALLRAHAPVYRNDALDFWALSKHADVLGAFRNVEAFSNRNGVSLDPSAYGPDAHRVMSFLAMDPPDHTRLRTLVGKAFSPRRVAALETRIREIAVGHLARVFDGREVDFIAEFAGRFPMDVISEMIGVPAADRARLRELADLVVHREEGVHDVTPEAGAASIHLVEYYLDMVAERRKRAGDDLISGLMEAELDGDRLTDEEVVGVLFLLVIAGNETTTKLLANMLYWGWRNPAEGAKPFADPGRIPDWVEETLRFDGSSQMVVRTSRTPIEVRGRTIPEGERVVLIIGSANHDEEVFPDPERYDLERDTKDLVSFGSGRHFCMGAHLARLEAKVAMEELVSRVAGYEIDESRSSRVHSINVRGFAELATSLVMR